MQIGTHIVIASCRAPVFLAQHSAADGEAATEERLGFGILALSIQGDSYIVIACRRMRVLFAQHAALDGQGSAQ